MINNDIHGACSIEFYKKSIEYISNNVSNPFIFIFSDDIKWARKNLKLDYPCEYISGNNGNKNYVDMQLMSLCKHNIIANSSFSWWGAWLNLNPNKIVIAPKQWYSDKVRNAQTSDLISNTWIRI